MRMDLFMLIFLSVPEYILSVPLMLLLSGKKEKLKFTIGNAIQFFITIALMLTASWIIRPLVSDTFQSVAYSTLAYTVIFLVVYRIRLDKTVLGVAWTVLYLITLENTFIPFVITYMCKGIPNFYSSNITLLVCSVPVRVFQALAVRYFYKNDDFLEVVREDKKYSIIFAVSSFLMCLAEAFISYVYYAFFDKFPFMIQLLFSCALLILMLSFYAAIFGFIFIIVKKLIDDVKDMDKKQKQQTAIDKKINDENLEELYNVLENEKDVGKAISLLKNHLDIKGEKDES